LRGRIEAEVKLEQQIVVLKKDAETEKRLAELRVKTLEETLAHNATQIAALISNWQTRSNRSRISQSRQSRALLAQEP
jgi:hypothetical protein